MWEIQRANCASVRLVKATTFRVPKHTPGIMRIKMAVSFRSLLPNRARSLLGSIRMALRERRLQRLPIDAAFDEVYRRQMWKQGDSLSGPGSSGSWADEYAKIVRALISDKEVKSAIDVGCGDFSVGRLIAPSVQTLIAMDISKYIIDKNTSRYSEMTNVRFVAGNACTDTIPKADLILVRQVFQHLTNEQIECALRRLEASQSRYILIAEHITRPELMSAPNIDLPSHTVRTRVGLKSGVMISLPPFSRDATLIGLLEPDASALAETGSILALSLIDNHRLA